jgi:uncharacterized protein
MTKKLEDFFSDPARKRRLLALDGGGVRGMFTIGVLQVLEQRLRDRYGERDYRLCRYFDLIAGTSTGSIIATGLALGMSTAEIAAYYKELCPKIFKSPAPSVWAALMSAKHNSGPLTKALGKAFGANTLASPKLETGLAINCMRLDRGSAWILCNNPRWKYYGDVSDHDGTEAAANKRYRLRDLVQASAAAPFYFRGVELTVATDESGKKSMEDGFFVDGGVSGNNNPALEMLMAVRDPAYGFNWPLGPDQLYLLNIGTGHIRGALSAAEMKGKAPWEQAKEALSAMIGAVSQEQVAVLQAMSHAARRWIINAEKGAQPSAPYLTLAGPSFEYQRVDARLDLNAPRDERLDEHAKALLGRELNAAEAKGLSEIDNPKLDNLMLLQELGRKAGERHFNATYPRAVFDEGRR